MTLFLEDARRYVARTAEAVALVPFHHESPTYRSMTPEQQESYFYWRDCVRQGRYPRASWSYIALYVAEIMHLVGVQDAEEGLRALLKVWKGYRGAYAVLETQMESWLIDFAKRHNCPWTSTTMTPDDLRLTFEMIDFDEVNRLHTQSHEILDLLRLPVEAELTLEEPLVDESTPCAQSTTVYAKPTPLSLTQVQILKGLSDGSYSTQVFEHAARESGTMLELLIDGINEWATAVLGDLVIDPGPPATIYPYSTEVVRTWIAGLEKGGTCDD